MSFKSVLRCEGECELGRQGYVFDLSADFIQSLNIPNEVRRAWVPDQKDIQSREGKFNS